LKSNVKKTREANDESLEAISAIKTNRLSNFNPKAYDTALPGAEIPKTRSEVKRPSISKILTPEKARKDKTILFKRATGII
jgi:hypothetical protein